MATLDAITTKFQAKGTTVTIEGLNDNSAQRHRRLSGHPVERSARRDALPVRVLHFGASDACRRWS